MGVSWTAALESGARALPYRDAVQDALRREHPELPLAMFLGDSTFLPGDAYPRLLARRLRERAEVRLVAWLGFEPFHHYLLAGRVAALEPRAVVIAAQLRLFWDREPLWYPDLLTWLPPGDLPRAARLPFHRRDVTLPRLALASLWGSLGEPAERTLRFFVGARRLARLHPVLGALVPAPDREADPDELERLRRERFLRYARPIAPDHSAIAALAAAVERTARAGARTLVIVSPIPVAALREEGLYDPAVFGRRIANVEAAVRAAGGELLDLHAILGPEDFTDRFGHMSEPGSQRVALVVDAWLRRSLAER